MVVTLAQGLAIISSFSTLDEREAIHYFWAIGGGSVGIIIGVGVFDIETILIGLSIQTNKICYSG